MSGVEGLAGTVWCDKSTTGSGGSYVCLSLSGKGKKQEEDTFGMNDEDWSVYREIVSLERPSQY